MPEHPANIPENDLHFLQLKPPSLRSVKPEQPENKFVATSKLVPNVHVSKLNVDNFVHPLNILSIVIAADKSTLAPKLMFPKFKQPPNINDKIGRASCRERV